MKIETEVTDDEVVIRVPRAIAPTFGSVIHVGGEEAPIDPEVADAIWEVGNVLSDA